MRRGFTIHHNGPPARCVGQPHTRCEAFWAAVVRYHTVDLGWSGVAYSFGVCHHGHRFVGRGWDRNQFANGSDTVGANDGNDSEWYTVLAFVGGDTSTGDTEPPTAQMVMAVAELIEEGRATGRCGDQVLPHNRFKRKPCPGPEFTALAAAWDRKPSPLLTPTEDPFAMFRDIDHFRSEVRALVREQIEAVHAEPGTDTRQGLFNVGRRSNLLGGFLAIAEDFETGGTVYWVTQAGKWEFPQGSPLHTWLKGELDNHGQSTSARRVPGPVLAQIPTVLTAALVELDTTDPGE